MWKSEQVQSLLYVIELLESHRGKKKVEKSVEIGSFFCFLEGYGQMLWKWKELRITELKNPIVPKIFPKATAFAILDSH